MKPRSLLATVFVAVSATVPAALAADASVTDSTAVPAFTAVFMDSSSPEAAEIRAVGDRAIKRLALSLVSEAWSVVAKDGAAKALEVCHLKHVPAMGAVIPDMPRITAFKRTSVKLRDAANAPDAADQLALDRVRRVMNNGELPPDLLVQRIEHSTGKLEWRVYRPLALAKQCVACHGATSEQTDELRTTLQARYPGDAAVNYTVGEWRGLLRVTVAEAAAAPAKQPVALTPAAKR